MPAFDLFNSFLKLFFNLEFRLAAFVDNIFNLIYLLFLFPLFIILFVLEVFSDSKSILLTSNNSPETLFSC